MADKNQFEKTGESIVELYDLEMKTIQAISDIEDYGCMVDVPYLQEKNRLLKEEIEQVDAEIAEIAPNLNPNSPSQLIQWFQSSGVAIPEVAPDDEDEDEEDDIAYGYEKYIKSRNSDALGLFKNQPIQDVSVRAEAEARYTVNKKALDKIDHPLAKLILRNRKLVKYKSAYVESMLGYQRQGVIHPNFRTLKARTGRLSCVNPALQTIPNDAEAAEGQELSFEEGLSIRRAFIPRPGCSLFAIDYSQQEYRVFVHLTKSERLIDLCKQKDFDFHSTVSKLTGLPRKQAKTCIAEGELVTTDKGLVPIEQVTTNMKVWDGTEWVSHEGIVDQGVKEVIYYDGLWATPDHEVILEDGSACLFERALQGSLRMAGSCIQRSNIFTRNRINRVAKVYDICNAGPKHRFTVSGVVVSNCSFGLLYGMGVEKLGVTLNCATNEAKKIMGKYFKNIDGTKNLIEKTMDVAQSRGYVKTLFGRPRFLYYKDRNGKQVNEVHKALNTIIQGTCADVMKIMLVKLNKKLKYKDGVSYTYPYGVRIILTIHDEIIFEVPHGQEGIIPFIKDTMELLPMVSVPMVADVSICRDNWSEKVKVTAEQLGEWRKQKVKILPDSNTNPYTEVPIQEYEQFPRVGLFASL